MEGGRGRGEIGRTGNDPGGPVEGDDPLCGGGNAVPVQDFHLPVGPASGEVKMSFRQCWGNLTRDRTEKRREAHLQSEMCPLRCPTTKSEKSPKGPSTWGDHAMPIVRD